MNRYIISYCIDNEQTIPNEKYSNKDDAMKAARDLARKKRAAFRSAEWSVNRLYDGVCVAAGILTPYGGKHRYYDKSELKKFDICSAQKSRKAMAR